MIDISIDTSELESELEAIESALEDLAPLWGHLHRAGLPTWFNRTFETDGFGNWKPTKQPNPILRDTLRYQRSFTGITSDTIDVRSASQWDYGSGVPYGKYHEYGTSHLPIRAVAGELAEQEEFNNWVAEETEVFLREVIGVY
ncbi:MAG: hypothetical protein F4166_08850 [Gammaproteobacteria bacterium]|nr:hypothetical protein [Gammaproteobacteria bacterium]